MKRKTKSEFIRGVWFFVALQGIYQDVLGLETYLRHVRKFWAPWWVSVPLCVAMLASVADDYHEDRWNDGDRWMLYRPRRYAAIRDILNCTIVAGFAWSLAAMIHWCAS